MTVTIDLRPEIEAGLAVLAAEQGISLTQYVSRLLEEQVPRSRTSGAFTRRTRYRLAGVGQGPAAHPAAFRRGDQP